MSSPHSWQLITSEIVFQHRWYTLRQDRIRLPNGWEIDDYFVSVRPDVVVILALTVDQQILLVRQYKHGVGQITLELPGGVIDDEHPQRAAERELREETGFACGQWISGGKIHSNPTKDTNHIHLFVGTQAVWVGDPCLDENEAAGGVQVEQHSISQAIQAINQGEIRTQASLMAIYRGLHLLRIFPGSERDA